MTKNKNIFMKFHFHPKKGWMNDPNGFIQAFNKYYIFYQYNPDQITHGSIKWGLAVSDDLIKFEEKDIALINNSSYDKDGCWSGSAIFDSDTLYLIYTGNAEHDSSRTQTQNIAYSKDGAKFEKYAKNPVIFENTLPKNCSISDIRDPSIFKEKDTYYVLIGNRSNSNKANLLLFKSKDMKSFEFDRYIIKESDDCYMFECPSSYKFDEKRILVASLIGYKQKGDEFLNHMSSAYLVTDENFSAINPDNFKEIDYGFDFYAPIICQNDNLMIAWMAMWDRNWYANYANLEYNHNLTLPRRITLNADNKLIQKPIESLRKYFKPVLIEEVTLDVNSEYSNPKYNGFYKHLQLELNPSCNYNIKLLSNKTNYGLLTIEDGYIIYDVSHYQYQIKGNPDEISTKQQYRKVKFNSKDKLIVDIYIDRVALEIFAEDGLISMSNMNYVTDDCDEFSISSTSENTVIIRAEDFIDE